MVCGRAAAGGGGGGRWRRAAGAAGGGSACDGGWQWARQRAMGVAGGGSELDARLTSGPAHRDVVEDARVARARAVAGPAGAGPVWACGRAGVGARSRDRAVMGRDYRARPRRAQRATGTTHLMKYSVGTNIMPKPIHSAAGGGRGGGRAMGPRNAPTSARRRRRHPAARPRGAYGGRLRGSRPHVPNHSCTCSCQRQPPRARHAPVRPESVMPPAWASSACAALGSDATILRGGERDAGGVYARVAGAGVRVAHAVSGRETRIGPWSRA